MAPPTLQEHKSRFLAAQVLQLSQPVAPLPAWRTANARSEAAISERALDEALYRLRHTLQQHARRVYAPQATRNVAEQIDRLYRDATEAKLEPSRNDGDRAEAEAEAEAGEDDGRGHMDAADDDAVLRFGVDLATDAAIRALPTTWAERNRAEAERHASEAERYQALHRKLQWHSARRAELRARVGRLRHLRNLLAPLSADGNGGSGGGGMQPNLVTRNGELEQELERTRLLLVRVADRVARLPAPVQQHHHLDDAAGDDDDEDLLGPPPRPAGLVPDLDAAQQARVAALLDEL